MTKQKLKCPHCSKTCKKAQALKRHCKAKHQEPKTVHNSSVASTAHAIVVDHRKFMCQGCHSLFDNKREFEIHIRDTTGHPCCALCKIPYRYDESLQYHMALRHAGQRPPAECLICRKQYESRDVLEEHVAAIHLFNILDTAGFRIVDGTSQYLLVNGSSPSEHSAQEADEIREPASPKAVDTMSGPETPVSQTTTNGHAEDGALSNSDPTSEENASPTESTLAAPGGPERDSSLVVSDSEYWSEFEDMSEIDTVGDFITVDVDRDDQSVSGLQDTVEGHGAFRTTSVSESTEEESHLSSSSSGDEASERGREPNKDQARKGLQPDTKPYRTTHTPSEAVSQGERSSVHPLTAAWICKVCNDVPASPMITMCGHVFCRKCILAEICENLRCPACKYPVLVEIKL